MIQDAVKKLVDGNDLSYKEAEESMNEIMSGIASPALISAFLVSLRLKGETVDEITAFASVMRKKATRIHPKAKILVDTCGTGGDKADTFNISTTSAFVVAGAGLHVAKHGNRSVSSKCGSADLLQELGVNINLLPKDVERCIDEVGVGFMFAPLFHDAMKHAMPVRKELGLRTVFNILGPLTNPANASAQVVGVFDEKLVTPLAEVLGKLGLQHAFVVHGNGIDEITIEAPTKVAEYKKGHVLTYNLDPTDFGFKLASLNEIKGGMPKENAAITLSILKGKEKGPKRDVVLLNSAAAIIAGGKKDNWHDAIALAEDSISSGKAIEILDKLKEWKP
ncbi:MAG TPA: anthranilate phosphoribosyltransferase [Candidatus Nanoarchaeia archaeon]|nr:anthranilate phosphoribosyltransferase [Candidatus Nanoarchaeia archaeon]